MSKARCRAHRALPVPDRQGLEALGLGKVVDGVRAGAAVSLPPHTAGTRLSPHTAPPDPMQWELPKAHYSPPAWCCGPASNTRHIVTKGLSPTSALKLSSSSFRAPISL